MTILRIRMLVNTTPGVLSYRLQFYFGSIKWILILHLNHASIENSFQFEKAMKQFCEDPRKMPTEEFFGVFDEFLGSFTDAQLDLEKFRREKEQEEKRAKMEAQVSGVYCCFWFIVMQVGFNLFRSLINQMFSYKISM